uniref:Mitochondrial import inner membrane translocase subunit TIM50 n=1 Tax=Alexandrium monilatum TaxID=311494 RepID=A0A7S4QT44_9DINO
MARGARAPARPRRRGAWPLRAAVLPPFLGAWTPSEARPSRAPLLVVLDLDETLVHATLRSGGAVRGCPAPPQWLARRLAQPRADFTARGRGLVVGAGEDVPLEVSLRPGALGFVAWLLRQPQIEVAVYTAGTRPYAEQVLDKLGLAGVRTALFRDSCEPLGLPITKDLSKLRPDLSRVVLVDNSGSSFWLQPENGLLVSDWDGSDAGDEELAGVRRAVVRLLEADDVRSVLPGLSRAAAAGDESRSRALRSLAVLAACAAGLATQVLGTVGRRTSARAP